MHTCENSRTSRKLFGLGVDESGPARWMCQVGFLPRGKRDPTHPLRLWHPVWNETWLEI